jgi:hypothetical protein
VKKFPLPVETGPGAHTVFCVMGTGSFPGVARGRGVTLTPPPSSAGVIKQSRAIPLLSLRVFVVCKKVKHRFIVKNNGILNFLLYLFAEQKIVV